jgi:hypothetical protein
MPQPKRSIERLSATSKSLIESFLSGAHPAFPFSSAAPLFISKEFLLYSTDDAAFRRAHSSLNSGLANIPRMMFIIKAL